VREQIPATRAVAVVVEPRAEDQVGCGCKEDPGLVSVLELGKDEMERLTE
jgi:hypothetical protein